MSFILSDKNEAEDEEEHEEEEEEEGAMRTDWHSLIENTREREKTTTRGYFTTLLPRTFPESILPPD